MPISFTPINNGTIWSGSTWVVDDEDELAELIARVAIGQSNAVEQILLKTDCLSPGMPLGGHSGARGLLTVGADPYQRDGWMFQIIAWIAANKQNKEALIRAPHMNHAHKGLDGLIIQFEQEEDSGVISQVVICEEKATTSPRKMVRTEVFPEFKEFEKGTRDHELIATVTSLLQQIQPEHCDDIVADILWNQKRAYRVSITVGNTHADESGRVKLFKGYETSVHGSTKRRRAETLFLDDLRSWMNMIALKAIAVINQSEGDQNV